MKILEIKPRSWWKTELYILLDIFRENWNVKVQLDNGEIKTIPIKFTKSNPTNRDIEQFLTYVKNKIEYGVQYQSEVELVKEKRLGKEAMKKQPEWITKLINKKVE